MLKYLIVLVILALGALLMWAAKESAHSQSAACGSTAGMSAALKEKYGETVLITAKTSQGNVMKIFFNAKTTTWTAAMEGGKTMCLVTSGKGLSFEGMVEGQSL